MDGVRTAPAVTGVVRRAVGTRRTPLRGKQPGTGTESPPTKAGSGRRNVGASSHRTLRGHGPAARMRGDGGGCDGQPVSEPPSHPEEGSYRQGLKVTSRLSPGFSSWRSKYKPQLGQAKVAGKVCGVLRSVSFREGACPCRAPVPRRGAGRDPHGDPRRRWDPLLCRNGGDGWGTRRWEVVIPPPTRWSCGVRTHSQGLWGAREAVGP